MKYAAIAVWADEKQYSVMFMCNQLGWPARAITDDAPRDRASANAPTPSSPT